MPSAPDTLVVTVTRNNLATVRETVPRLKELTRRPFHYAVVANGDAESGQWLLENRGKGWFDSYAVLSDNVGVSPAYNLFWRHFHRFSREVVYAVKFDDDNLPTRPDWLDDLIDLACYFKGRLGMTGYLVAGNDNEWPEQVIEGWPVRPTPTNCSGSCCLIPRWVWEEVGLWDEEVVGWVGPERNQGPIYYSREDGLMGQLCQIHGLQNLYHADLRAIRWVGPHPVQPAEYSAWKESQYATAYQFQYAIAQDYRKHQRTLPHRPPL